MTCAASVTKAIAGDMARSLRAALAADPKPSPHLRTAERALSAVADDELTARLETVLTEMQAKGKIALAFPITMTPDVTHAP
ncbi:hypothetical protein [Burkholderia gladioli]|uniref:hypothetical protein n=1 Tax=Burkholderia gladioli TaxID=28095 RepID=UPI001641A9BD|nr:hypothetical protein [Burkholderia gladioli]